MKVRSGLTTVELIVTLFVAALFIISGYQLFGAVNLRAGNTREMSEASNIAYKILRSDGSTYVATSNACTSPTSTTATVGASTLPSPTAKILRCRPNSASSMIRVTVEVEYGNNTPKRKVVHAIYVTP